MRSSYKSALLFMLGAIGALGYFTWHGLHGSRGIERVAALNVQVQQLQGQLDDLKAKREKLEKTVVLLRPESIDPDKLDEEARALLDFATESDRSIPIDVSSGTPKFAE